MVQLELSQAQLVLSQVEEIETLPGCIFYRPNLYLVRRIYISCACLACACPSTRLQFKSYITQNKTSHDQAYTK